MTKALMIKADGSYNLVETNGLENMTEIYLDTCSPYTGYLKTDRKWNPAVGHNILAGRVVGNPVVGDLLVVEVGATGNVDIEENFIKPYLKRPRRKRYY